VRGTYVVLLPDKTPQDFRDLSNSMHALSS
jgi:hypothetical protein